LGTLLSISSFSEAQETFYIETPEGLQDIVYLDGTYFGESADFTVEILVYQNEIRNIAVIEMKDAEKRQYSGEILQIIDQIIKEQSAEEVVPSLDIPYNDYRNTFLFAVRHGLFKAIEKYSHPYADPFLQALKLANDYIIFQGFYYGDPLPPVHERDSLYKVTYEFEDLKIKKDVLVNIKTRDVIFEP
jgi:hypothetical protein